MNKIDCLPDFKARMDFDKDGRIYRVWICAKTGEGIDFLYQALAQQLGGMIIYAKIQLDVIFAAKFITLDILKTRKWTILVAGHLKLR